MNMISLRTLPAWTGLLCLTFASAQAQAPKPAADAPKPPVHKPEQSALNRLKQDDRSKKALSDAVEKLREAAKNHESADKEMKRGNAKDLKEDPGKALDAIKDKLSPEDTAALKEAMEKAKEALNSDDAKKAIEEVKKKAAAASSAKPKTPTTTPPEKFGPSTFDQVPAPQPTAPEAAPVLRKTPGFVVTGKDMILPPTNDPDHPERTLSPKDPRSRTYVVTGNAQVKTPNMVLEGDRIELLASEEGGGDGLGGLTVKKPAKGKDAKISSVDPVQPGINNTPEDAKKAAPFDRVIATGRVNIVRIVNGKPQSGKGGSMIYDRKTDEMLLTDWPEAQDGVNVVTGTRKDAKIILVPKGKTRFEDCTLTDVGDSKTARATPSAETTRPASPVPAPRAVPVR